MASLITTSAPTVVDLVMPFLMGVAEYTHFSMLTPVPGPASEADQLFHLTWWPLLFGLLTACALVEITATKRVLPVDPARMSADRVELLTSYKRYLGQSQRSIAAVTVLLGVVFVLLREGPAAANLRKWQGLVGCVVLAAMVAGILATEQARRHIIAHAELPNPEPADEPATAD